VKATGAEFNGEKVCALMCEDLLTQKKIKIRAKHFLSTVGPWTDKVATDMFKKWKPILRPSKGVHLTLDRNRLPLHDAVVMSTRADKRIVFGIPRHEMIIIGTTDTDFNEDPANVKTTAEDVKYLLGIIDQYFPEAKIQESDILASYAGVRPLVADDSETESATSREHVILEDPRNITFVAGGKYTTYRHMAAEIVEAALRALPQSVRDTTRTARTDVPLNPMVSSENYWRSFRYVERWAGLSKFSPKVINALVTRHGMETEHMLASVEDQPQFADKWSVEAIHAIEKTMCLSLLDFYVRRTPLMLARRDHGVGILDWMAKVFQMHLGWSEEKTRAEVGSVHSFIHSEFAWRSQL
jgi:glycerol-3-phosphate dehydrogenase